MNYRNALIGLIFLLSIGIPASAQVGDYRNNWSIGVNGGMNLNKVTFQNLKIKQNYLKGVVGGITARYISEKYFALICGVQAELNYSQRGWDEKIEDNANTYSRVMNYLELPFLAHLAIGKEPRGVQFFINLGPQIAFLLNEKEHFSNDWDPSTRPGGVNIQYGKPADKKFDYGIVGGGGIELKTKAGNFLLEGRYYFGLSDFYNNTKKDPFARSAHSTISVRLTYLFDLTRTP